jgi:YVTN family beta-propeller protein
LPVVVLINRSVLVFVVAILIVTAAFIPISALLTHYSSQQSSTATTTADTFVPTIANETLQFVGAEVVDLESSNAVAINATYTNNLSQPLSAMVEAIAYPAQAQYEAVNIGGKPLEPVCCPIARSYSTSGSVSASAQVNADSREEISTNLVFSSLNTTVIYWVKLSAVSLNGTTALSPVSYVLLETAGAAEGSYGGGAGACGGQEDVGPIFADPDNGQVYVANPGTDAISVLDGSTGRLVATISLPEMVGQFGFSYDSGNRELYVSNIDSNDVYAIDTSTNYLVGEVVQPPSNGGVYLASGKMFGIDFGGNLISIIDESTNTVVANITGLQSPEGSTYSSGNNELYVETYNQTVFAIDLNDYRVVAKIPIPYEYNSDFLYDPGNGLLYTVTNGVPLNSSDSSPAETAYLLMINSSSNALLNTTILLPHAPNGTSSSSMYGYQLVMYNPSNKDIYVYGMDMFSGFDTSNPDRLLAIDTANNTVVASIPVWGVGGGLVQETPSFFLDPSSGNIYATTDLNPGNGTTGLLEISGKTNQVISQVTLTGFSFGEDSVFDSNSDMLFGPGIFASVLMLNPSSGALAATTVLGTCSFVSGGGLP